MNLYIALGNPGAPETGAWTTVQFPMRTYCFESTDDLSAYAKAQDWGTRNECPKTFLFVRNDRGHLQAQIHLTYDKYGSRQTYRTLADLRTPA